MSDDPRESSSDSPTEQDFAPKPDRGSPRVEAREAILLIAILALAAGFRLAALGSNPPGVFRDEAEKALNAWAIRETGAAFEFAPGTDGAPAVRWRKFPLFIDVFGVKTSAIYQYALAPFAFGDTPPSPRRMRLPAALAGIAAVGALYTLLRLLYGAPMALGAALWLAISPWQVAFSRWALQGSFVPLFITLGIGGLALGLRRHPRWLALAGLGLGLAFYAYSGARPFVLAFGLAAIVIERQSLWAPQRRRWALGAAAIFLLLATPTLMMMMAPGGAARLGNISVFGEGRNFGQALWAMAKNYAVHFSPKFLVLRGDEQIRHGVKLFGQLHLMEFLFALLGGWMLWRDRAPERRLGLAWLLLFPVGAMLTRPSEMPHALRSIVALPLPQILAGYGLAAVFAGPRLNRQTGFGPAGKFRHRVFAGAIAILIAGSAALHAFELFQRYPRYSLIAPAGATAENGAGDGQAPMAFPSHAWESGFGQALAFAREAAGAESNVAISAWIAMGPYLTLYYDEVPPARLREEGWQALRAIFLPPQYDLSADWWKIPPGTVVLCPAQEPVAAEPLAVFHPPSLSEEERRRQAPSYAVYRKE